ncbi:MAG: MFS transporter [Cellulomonadaceae bacterium]
MTAADQVQRAAWAVFAVFVLNGFNFASWASRLPAVRDRLSFSEAQMGMLLLGMAVGSIVALPLSGWILERWGARRTVIAFAALNVAGFGAAGAAVGLDSVPALRIALVVAGMGTGVWDAAMNLEGAVVEQRLGRTIMPRLHAGYSFGTILGAGAGIVMARQAVPFEWHVPVAVTVSLACVLVAVRFFLPSASAPRREPAGTRGPARPNVFAAWLEPRTLVIGLVVLGAALTEGAANDWVGLAVVDGFGQEEHMGAVALTVFLVAMTTMRLLGTALLDRRGRVVVLRISCVLAFVGLSVFALAPPLWLALLGVVAWGAGAALGFPVGMSAASDDPVRAAARVSVVSTIGYSAFFMGPPLLGLLAEHVGYRHALLAILVPIALGLLLAPWARPLRDEQGDSVEA